MPDGFEMADAYVEVTIDDTSLDRDIAAFEARLRAIRGRAIEVGIDMSELDPQLLAVQNKINTMMSRIRARVEPDLDEEGTRIAIDNLLKRITKTRTKLNIIPDTDEIRRSMALLEARLKAMKGEIDIGFDPSKLQSELAMVRAEFDSIHNKTLDIGIDSGKLYEAFLQIRLQVDQLNKAFELKPRMNTEELKADLAEVRAMIVAVQKDFNIQFKMEGVDRVIGEMQGVNFQLDRLKTSMAEYVAISSLSGVGSGGRRWWLNWVHWIIAGGA